MPYKRKRYRKKRYYRNKWYSPRNMAGYSATALTALKIAKEVKSMINTEKKYFDDSVNTSVLSASAGEVQLLTDIQRGDDHNERDGDSIKLQGIQIKGYVLKHASATYTQIRVLLLKEIDRYATEPNYASGNETSVFTTANVISLRERDNSKKYIILWDRMYMLDSNITKAQFKIFIKNKSHVTWDKDDGYRSGHLYMMAISNEATNGPSLIYESRVTYIDN